MKLAVAPWSCSISSVPIWTYDERHRAISQTFSVNGHSALGPEDEVKATKLLQRADSLRF
jgi:hypothetical protein